MVYRAIIDFDGKLLGIVAGAIDHYFFNKKYNHKWTIKLLTKAEYETYLAFGFEDLEKEMWAYIEEDTCAILGS